MLPGLIDAGLDIIQPVQTTCQDMEPERLKREFGRDLCLWGGGCDTQSILPHASPDDIRKHVQKQVDILAPHGDFVFQQVHNIMANVPPQNIVAMFNSI